ncbi:MAG: lysine--tRNA ligase [Candidatus Dependentiae bacterium]|nr:lysine--tRNA ligase [Candidatus Dependentiae bacterium]
MKKNENIGTVETQAPLSVSDEHRIRLEKVEVMRKAGIEPWPAGKLVNAVCKDVIDEYVEGAESREYAIEGRLMALRGHGKTIFAQIQDRSGLVQVYIKQDILGDDAFANFNNFVDIGDIVWVKGQSFKTKTGEITLKVTEFALQSKCLYPLPDKFHGLADIEVRYRQRYLDLISSSDSRERFKKRSAIVRTMRSYFDTNDFMEVETPMLHPIPGGAAAKPFVTHHNALDSEFYLRIAPELYLKRLVVGGFDRVYEINRNFRNEGISTRHNPEFTMVEFYTAYQDYNWAMDFVDNMFKKIAMESCGALELPFGDHIIDFGKPFARLSMKDAVIKYGNFAKGAIEGDAIDAVLKNHGFQAANKNASWGEKLLVLFEKLVEPQLIQPTFITHFPIEVSPLAKRDPQDPSIAARFELFIAGMEISNGFNELNDPFDQASRFHDQAKARTAGDDEAHFYDAEFIHALDYALPPTAGVGIGIDRLVMLMTNTTSIKDVILFPTLKRKH